MFIRSWKHSDSDRGASLSRFGRRCPGLDFRALWRRVAREWVFEADTKMNQGEYACIGALAHCGALIEKFTKDDKTYKNAL